MPQQIYCWQCCGLVCLLHVVVIEDDWTGTPHKMPVGLSVHEFSTPQLQRPESSFLLLDMIFTDAKQVEKEKK